MYVVVTYDISTKTQKGQKRLRRVAKTCLDYGQRVQQSVFELSVAPAQWTECKARLIAEIDFAEDSVRIYYLGSNWDRKVEHIGANEPLNVEGPLFA